jgi:hypothetical protein
MSISPVLFNSVLDSELKRVKLTSHYVRAWADDLVFIAKSRTELCAIINKLKKLEGGLEVNLKKSKVLIQGDSVFRH